MNKQQEEIAEQELLEQEDYLNQMSLPNEEDKPPYPFTSPKNAYISRDEYLRLDPTIQSAERVDPNKRSAKNLMVEVDANNSRDICDAYIPSFYDVEHEVGSVSDCRSDAERLGEMTEEEYEGMYGDNLTKAFNGKPYKSRFDHDEYVPLINTMYDLDGSVQKEWSVWGYKGYKSKYHSQYFMKKVDQGILDATVSYNISMEKGFDELTAFSFPYLAGTNESNKTYDFIKIIVSYKNFERNLKSQFPEYDYVIRIFRITNSKTSCTERYVHGDEDLAYEVAKDIYYKWENKSQYCVMYDLEAVNDIIKQNINPIDESVRFLPDGFYKDKAYVHDRESDSYVELGDWKKRIKKKAILAEKQSKKLIKDMDKNKEVMDLIKQKAAELTKNKSTKETIEWLKSL